MRNNEIRLVCNDVPIAAGLEIKNNGEVCL
jgi:hypothetical protein